MLINFRRDDLKFRRDIEKTIKKPDVTNHVWKYVKLTRFRRDLVKPNGENKTRFSTSTFNLNLNLHLPR